MAPSAGLRDVPAQPYQDTARSWVVAVACSWSLFWTMIITRCSGIIFVALVSEMGATREAASWPFNIVSAIVCVSGFIGGLLLKKFPPSVVSRAGCLLTTLGVLLSAAFYDVTGITICYGLLGGLGQGFVYLSNDYVINVYFKRFRASASGINWAGSSLSVFVFPSVVVYLNDKYGLRGTFLIVGALTLNAVAGSLFMSNPEELVKKVQPRGSRERVNGDINWTGQGKRINACSHHTLPEACKQKQVKGDYNEPEASVALTSMQTDARMEMPTGNTLPRDMSLSSRVKQNYTGEAGRETWPSQQSMDTSNGEGRNANRPSCVTKTELVSVLRRELVFLKRPITYILMLSGVVYSSVAAVYGVTLADHAMGQGLPEWQAALLVSSNGAGDITAQLLLGQISDRKFCQRRDVVAISFLLMASSLVGLIYAKSMALLVLVTLLYSLASGSILTLGTIIMVEYLGLENLPLAFSFQSLVCAIVAFPRPLLIGYYRDRRESYSDLYLLLAALCFAMGLIWTVECLLQWRASKRLRGVPGQS